MDIRALFVLLCLTALASCATMNKSECLTADWYSIGYEDGIDGQPQTKLSRYRQDCADHGVTPKLDAYRNGHFEGSKQFCTRENGFQYGHKGHEYQRSCPSSIERDFLIGYRDGRHLYAVGEQVAQYQRQLERTYQRISELQEQIQRKSDDMIADGLTRDDRLAIRDEIASLQESLAQLESDIPFIQDDLEIAEQNYLAVEASLTRYFSP